MKSYTLKKVHGTLLLKGGGMMITGKDSISLQVLEAFTQKQKLADIAAVFKRV